MLQIQTIMDRAEQGITSPFICMAENSLEYFVKGLHATRASQINEWIGGNIAQALSLPVVRLICWKSEKSCTKNYPQG